MNTEDSVWVDVPFEVQKPHHGLRLDAYLAGRLHRYSRCQVQRLIEDGRVSLPGRAIKPATRVICGETVLIRYPRHQELPCPHDELPVVYEDECLLVINKPAPLLCHPTDRIQNNTVTSILKRQFPGQRLHLVHRLDRETSGTLLLAKNPKAATAAAKSFVNRKVRKEYLTLVFGRVNWRRTLVDAALGREDRDIKVRQAVYQEDVPATAASAQTEFERLAGRDTVSLVRALPKTGRLHQIRVHLAHLGHPVLGDKLYLGKGELYMKAVRKTLTPEDMDKLGAQRQMLHAHRLTLPHPGTGRELSVASPLPDDFRRILQDAGIPLP